MVITDQRSRPKGRLVYSSIMLWYAVSNTPVLLAISRDPEGVEHDDYWVCSNVSLQAQDVLSAYAGRWSIDDTFRATKQHSASSIPSPGPTRPRASCRTGFLGLPERRHRVVTTPWYEAKCTPSV